METRTWTEINCYFASAITVETANQMSRRKMTWVAVGIAVFAGTVYYATTRDSRAEDIAAMSKIGVATSDSEVQALWQPRGTNAAIIYSSRRLRRLMFDDTAKKLEDMVSRQKVADPTPAEINALAADILALKKYADPLRAASKMDCSYFGPINQTAYGPYDQFGMQWSTMANGAFLLDGLALFESQQGDTTTAISDLVAAYNINRQAGQMPGSNCIYEGLWQQDVFRTWRRVLQDHSGDRKTLEGSLAAIQKLEEPDLVWEFKTLYSDVLKSWRKIEIDPAKHFKDIAANKPGTKPQPNNVWTRFLLRKVISQAIHNDRKFYESMPKDGTDVAAVIEALWRENERTQRQWPVNSLMTAGTFQSYHLTCREYARYQAMRRMTLLSCKLLLERLDHGSIPKTIADYGKDSLEPLANDRFQYRVVGKGFEMFSPSFVNERFDFK